MKILELYRYTDTYRIGGRYKDFALYHNLYNFIRIIKLIMVSRKRSVIWDYFAVNPEDERITICNTCDKDRYDIGSQIYIRIYIRGWIYIYMYIYIYIYTYIVYIGFKNKWRNLLMVL